MLPVLSLLFGSVSSSAGDAFPVYRECTDQCRIKLRCPHRFDDFGWAMPSCFSCKYDCIWQSEETFRQRTGRVPQFHGKWPFAALRLGPILVQEPASAFFSLLNLCSVVLFYLRLGRLTDVPHRDLWRQYCLIGMLTWVSSSLFHCFDCWITERLDYFSACAFVFAGFSVSAVFTIPELSSSKIGNGIRFALPWLCLFLWSHHVWSMSLQFDYEYNMKLCVLVSGLAAVLYARFLFSRYRMAGRLTPADRLLFRTVMFLNGSVLLELLDFPPLLWTFDAHSLFHAATVPAPFWLCSALQMYTREKSVMKDL